MFLNRRSGRAAAAAEPERPYEPTDSPQSGSSSAFKLRSLAPRYEESQHATYVRHLEAAVLDPKNRNIALTGRYGSGKSSILDEFLAGRENTLRISINTLGPDDGEDLTNRIQKELVKQLVYRAEPGKVRRSRFARSRDLTWWRSLRDAVVVSVVVCGLLWLFGVRPDADALGPDNDGWTTAAFVALVVVGAWVARWVIGNRLVSEFSTGVTSISLETQPDSYFDEYLDEIMAFFDATQPDLVVFEDLDRFDDPRIFDSLRELNTLINASAHWKDRQHPLRFVYAIKDSLFEKLVGEHRDGKDESDPTPEPQSRRRRDAAEVAVERANRTKFFDVVIPVVPFLSHNNARDLLTRTLNELGMPAGTEISRDLRDLVARHATDMRLLINICNEFVVFAQRLLWTDENRAPGISADVLFALVVYKNFHLADFEKLPYRGSVLDKLELKRQVLVRDAIKQLQHEKRQVSRDDRLQREQDNLAQGLGGRLMTLFKATGLTIVTLSVGEQTHAHDSIHQAAFWRAVAEARSLKLALHDRYSQPRELSLHDLKALFPETLDPVRWREPSAEELKARLASIDEEVARLRGAGFADLVKDGRAGDDGKTFADHLEDVLESELARDLVRRGFVDRYYAEYSAAFYGDFLGVDVANFFRNSVWPNEMDIQARFQTPDAVRNLFEQAPAGFTSSRSALNIEVVDYALEHRPDLAKEIITFLVAEHGEDAAAFLEAYLNDASSRKAELIRCLAEHPWPGLLDHLALPDSVMDETTRTALLDAALLGAQDAKAYTLSEDARALIVDRHAGLTAFTEERAPDRVDVVLSFVRRVGLRVPSLRPLSASIRRRMVDEGAYELTVDNLRTALGLEDDVAPTLDRIREVDGVWQRCRDDADAYFDAVDEDDRTEHAVLSAETLREVISEQHEDWSEDQIKRLLGSSAPDTALPDITDVPQASWPAIADARRIVPTGANLSAYAEAFGVDEHLAKVLVVEPGIPVELEGLDDLESDVIHGLIVRILNASQVLGSKDRVWLALQLDPEPRHDSVAATELQPSGDDLLAQALEADLVPDTAATFAHFLTGGWASVSAAFKVSAAARDFVTPELVAGHVLDLLRDPQVPDAIKAKVVSSLGAYAANADGAVLSAAASFAHKKQIRLPVADVERAAPHVRDPEHILWQLAGMDAGVDGRSTIRVLGLLGDEYEGFNGTSGDEFEVPATDSIKAILDRLKADGLVTTPRGGARGRKRVALV